MGLYETRVEILKKEHFVSVNSKPRLKVREKVKANHGGHFKVGQIPPNCVQLGQVYSRWTATTARATDTTMPGNISNTRCPALPCLVTPTFAECFTYLEHRSR